MHHIIMTADGIGSPLLASNFPKDIYVPGNIENMILLF